MKQFDEPFIQKLKHHDHDAFNDFYLQTVDIFFRYLQANYFLSQEDCDDIIADFYVKRREVVQKYDDKQSFMWYVWTVFKNLLKDHFKKMSDLPFSTLWWGEEEENFEDILADEEDIKDLLEQHFHFEHIMNAMKQLDDISRDIIYWKFIEEKTHKEIEDMLWLNSENVRQRLSRAVKKLKALLLAE